MIFPRRHARWRTIKLEPDREANSVIVIASQGDDQWYAELFELPDTAPLPRVVIADALRLLLDQLENIDPENP